MEAQRDKSRAARADKADLILRKMVRPLPTQFVGYEFTEYESTVLGIFSQHGESPTASGTGEFAIITQETPFYAESGGQIGDIGTITSNDCSIEVFDTQKIGTSIIHLCKITDGEIGVGTKVRLTIDEDRRSHIRRNHTATHLLHKALRTVLGDSVKQSGSKVSDTLLRFDYSHDQPLTSEQITSISEIINQAIRANYEVTTTVMSLEEAQKTGAMALFDEKYGSEVRVVKVGDFSCELCGGTHAKRSGDIGFFILMSDSAVQSGVRRIEAKTGYGAEQFITHELTTLNTLSQTLKVTPTDLIDRVNKLLIKNKELERQVNTGLTSQKLNLAEELAKSARKSETVGNVVAAVIENITPKELRELVDDLKVRLKSACIALASVQNDKPIIIVAVTDDLTSRLDAGKLISVLGEMIGTRGGGRKDMAQAGGGDPAKLKDAINSFLDIVHNHESYKSGF